jgi:hypothetical protein
MFRPRYSIRALLALTLLVAVAAAVVRWHMTAAPDLVITGVRFSPAAPKPGEGIATFIAYKNVGRLPAENFYLKQTERTGHRSNDGYGYGGGQLKLKPGEQGEYQWGGIILPQLGRYEFKFIVDSENTIPESNEENNTFRVQLQTKE